MKDQGHADSRRSNDEKDTIVEDSLVLAAMRRQSLRATLFKMYGQLPRLVVEDRVLSSFLSF